ncbi:MAG TPA: NAD-dependent epimerase/dehydratase family protein [Woeseiaceae bacterium]
MQIAVIGAGYVGSRVLDSLGPHAAIACGRSLPVASRHSVRHLDLDREPLLLQRPMPARILYTVPPSANSSDSPGDPRLTRFLGALDPPPEHIVYISTSGVYGDCGGELVDESRHPAPRSPRALRRFAAERQLLNWCSKSGSACIILRVPGIYGPGRLGVKRIIAAGPLILESEANPGNRVHVDDLVAATIAALNRSIPQGIYNIGDGDFRSTTWFAVTVARLAGLAAPRSISKAEALDTLSPARTSFLLESRKLDTTRMRQVLGVQPRYADAEDGIRASLRVDGLLRDPDIAGAGPAGRRA